MTLPVFKGYIFDVDGTLVDSAADICGAVQGVLASTDKAHVPFDVLRGYIGRHLDDLWQDLWPGCEPDRMASLLSEYRRSYLARQHASTTVFPGTKEALASLPGRKATATTKSTPTTRAILGLFGLLPFFDHVQGTDGFPAKPNPDVLFKAAEGLGLAVEDCLFVGDSAADMEAAKRAGMKSCAVTWGYGKREDMQRWSPDYWVRSWPEVDCH